MNLSTKFCGVRARSILISLAVLGCLFAVGACLPFPLGDPEKSTVDPKLIGVWKYEKGEDGILAVMYPFDGRAYVMEYYEYKKVDNQPVKKNVEVFKAWLTDVKARTFLTLEPLSQRLPSSKDEKKSYPVFKVSSAADNGFEARRVNEDFDGFKDVKNSDDVANVITREIDNPKLYVDDAWNFQRLDGDAASDLYTKLHKAAIADN